MLVLLLPLLPLLPLPDALGRAPKEKLEGRPDGCCDLVTVMSVPTPYTELRTLF